MEGVNIMDIIILKKEKKKRVAYNLEASVWIYSGKDCLNETVRGNQFTT